MLTTTLPSLNLGLITIPDSGSIAIADLSSYLVTPSVFSLQITPPGYQMINVPFTPGSVNIYRCLDLGINCAPLDCCSLPDGIYDVIYTVQVIAATNNISAQNAVIEKTFIKVDQITCKFQKAFGKVDLDCNCGEDEQKRLKHELYQIDLLINGAVAAANDCDPAAAYRFYHKADSMLDKISCKFGLPCSAKWYCPECH